MANWSVVGNITPASGGGVLTGLLPGGVTVGDLILVPVYEKSSGNTVPSLAGYAAPANADIYMKIYAKIAVGSDPNPSATFSNGYIGGVVIRWIGGTAPAIGAIVDSSGVQTSNGVAVNISFAGLTPSQNGCFVLAFGRTLGGGATVSIADPAQFPNNIDMEGNINTAMGVIVDYVNQTTAAAITSGNWIVTNGGSNTVHSIVLPIAPGNSSGGVTPTLMATGCGN